MNNIVEQAITSKKLIEFTYGGHLRRVEPHVLGINAGITQVLCYQVGGSSSSDSLPNWRRFDLPKISMLKLTDESFPGRRPFPSGEHSPWDETIAIVS